MFDVLKELIEKDKRIVFEFGTKRTFFGFRQTVYIRVTGRDGSETEVLSAADYRNLHKLLRRQRIEEMPRTTEWESNFYNFLTLSPQPLRVWSEIPVSQPLN